MRILTLFICLFVSGVALARQQSPGNFKGHEKLSREISTRLFELNQDFRLIYYLNNDRGLGQVLGGTVVSEGMTQEVNRAPSSAGLLFYYFVFVAFTDDLAQACFSNKSTAAGGMRLSGDFWNALRRICQLPNTKGLEDTALRDLWDHIAGYETTEEEYSAWADFVHTFGNLDESTLSDILLAAFLNPHSLLEK